MKKPFASWWEVSRITASGGYGDKATPTYQSDRSCKNDHVLPLTRYTSNGICVECLRMKRKPRLNALLRPVGVSGGNKTSGPDRRGFHGGRARLYPEGTMLHRFALQLADAEASVALYLGGGNATKGIRKALEAASQQGLVPPEIATLNRFATEDRIKMEKRKAALGAKLLRLGMTQETVDRDVAAMAENPHDWDDVTPGDDNDDEA